MTRSMTIGSMLPPLSMMTVGPSTRVRPGERGRDADGAGRLDDELRALEQHDQRAARSRRR